MNKQSTVMAIDTSTATMAGALMRNDQLLASVQTEAERNHSIHIMTNIEEMLAASGVKLHELEGIVTGIGPGSYTGVRIAVTAAKTLAWTAEKQLIGVSSLAGLAFSGVLAEESTLPNAIVIPLMDARRGQVYTAAFAVHMDSDTCSRLDQDHIVMMDKWCQYWELKLHELKDAGLETIAFFGDVGQHEASISAFHASAEAAGLKVLAKPHQMNGQALAMLGRGQWLNERVIAADPHELVPNYAQLTEAEVKQNAKEQEEGKR